MVYRIYNNSNSASVIDFVNLANACRSEPQSPLALEDNSVRGMQSLEIFPRTFALLPPTKLWRATKLTLGSFPGGEPDSGKS